VVAHIVQHGLKHPLLAVVLIVGSFGTATLICGFEEVMLADFLINLTENSLCIAGRPFVDAVGEFEGSGFEFGGCG
jgi:hypothetical protein